MALFFLCKVCKNGIKNKYVLCVCVRTVVYFRTISIYICGESSNRSVVVKFTLINSILPL